MDSPHKWPLIWSFDVMTLKRRYCNDSWFCTKLQLTKNEIITSLLRQETLRRQKTVAWEVLGIANNWCLFLECDHCRCTELLWDILLLKIIITLTYGRHGVIKGKHFPRYWPFVRGIHRSPVNFPHKGQWREALMFSLICAWINGWVNNREAGDFRRHRAHYDVHVINYFNFTWSS